MDVKQGDALEVLRNVTAYALAELADGWHVDAYSIDSTGGGCTASVATIRYGVRSCSLVIVADHAAPTLDMLREYADEGAELFLGVYDGSEWCAGGYPFDSETGRGFVPRAGVETFSVAEAVARYLSEWALS